MNRFRLGCAVLVASALASCGSDAAKMSDDVASDATAVPDADATSAPDGTEGDMPSVARWQGLGRRA